MPYDYTLTLCFVCSNHSAYPYVYYHCSSTFGYDSVSKLCLKLGCFCLLLSPVADISALPCCLFITRQVFTYFIIVIASESFTI
jgi:hypothetical protein